LSKRRKISVVIPARFQSSRLPGKPLINIKGIPMLVRTWMQCAKVIDPNKIFVATDNIEIEDMCKQHDINVIMSSGDCLTGTDRVSEVAKKIDSDIYINVQGDEPVLNPHDLEKIIDAALKEPNSIFCGYCQISSNEQYKDFNIPKVVVSEQNKLLYMSRSPIPGNKNGSFIKSWRQVCIYAFPKKALEAFVSCKTKTNLEKIEDIELLRFLELGWEVQMIEVSDLSIAVDIPEDILKVEKAIVERNL